MVQINELIGNKKLMEIVGFFIRYPSLKISQSGLIKKTRLAKATMIKWLRKLEQANILAVEKIGVTKLYALNNDNLIIKQLKIIDTIGKLNDLEKTAKEFNIEIYLFGSAARGENLEESDIDLLIIGNIKRNQIILNIDKLSKRLNTKINLQIFSQLEWSQVHEKDKAFYERVEKDKMRLF